MFESKIKPYLVYVGAIGALLTSVAYIVCIFTLIKGFQYSQPRSAVIYAGVNAVIGLIISNFLKYQGVCFAKEKNAKIVEEYFGTKTKDKKNHNLTYFWATSIIKDILVKGLSFGAATAGIIYIVIEGSNDWSLLMMGFVNLLMFISFGILALDKAYDYYNNVYVNYIKEKINERAKEIKS